MKKLLSIILTAVMVVFAAAALVPVGAGATHGYLLGDANDDGDVTSKDVLLTRRYIAGLEDVRDIDAVAADVNIDDDVTSKDVLVMRRFIAGLDDLEGNNEDGEYKVDVISVGDRNITRYTVVAPEGTDPCVNNAADVLIDRIRRACGYKMNKSTDESAVDGCKIVFRHDNDDEYGVGSDGFKIKVEENGDVDIWCGPVDHQRGALYASYHILEEFVGYRFLIAETVNNDPSSRSDTHTEDITYLYKSEKAVIPAGYDEEIVPKITYRAISQVGRTNENFSPLHINDIGAAGHAEYGWRVGTLYIHAHSYAYQMAGPDRAYDHEWIDAQGLHNTQPCLTSEVTYEKIIEFNSWLVEDRKTWGAIVNGERVGNDVLGKTYTQVSCSPNDNTSFCTCSNCKAVYELEGSISGTVFRLANRVDEYMNSLYPGIETYTIAYWDARRPPKFTRPRDTICVCYCIGGCNNHPYDHTELCAENGGNPRLYQVNWDGTKTTSSNVDDIDYYLKWTELTNNIQIWYYSCLYTYYLTPAQNIFNIYNDIKYLASTGTTGVYFEGSGSARYCFEYLRGYLATKMMWNPYMSEEEYNDLINEFLWIFYGEGWREIRQYLEMANYAADLQGCWTNNYDRPWEIYNEDYFEENYKEMASLFDTAYEKAGDSDQRRRVLQCRMQCDFLGLSATYERDWTNGDEAARAEFKDRYLHLYNYIVDNDVYVAGLGGSSRTGCENFPTSTADDKIIAPMEWLWEGCDGHWHYIGGRWQ